jgi:hypothetical protein
VPWDDAGAYLRFSVTYTAADETAEDEFEEGEVGAAIKTLHGILGAHDQQLLDKLAAITGLTSPKVKVPYGVALAAGIWGSVVVGGMLKREPRATVEAVQMSRKKMFVSRRASSVAVRLAWATSLTSVIGRQIIIQLFPSGNSYLSALAGVRDNLEIIHQPFRAA